MTLRVGIISANWGAVAHLPAWRSVPGVEVVGICTSRRETAEAAAKANGIKRSFWDAASPDFEQAWTVERVLEAARRSTEQRRWVRLEEIC